jgi:DNA replication licensing factor MCM7
MGHPRSHGIVDHLYLENGHYDNDAQCTHLVVAMLVANPLYGCHNLNPPPSISCNYIPFLPSLFVAGQLEASCDNDDKRLVQHITYFHMYGKHPDLEYKQLDLANVIPLSCLMGRPTLSICMCTYASNPNTTLRPAVAVALHICP